MALLEIRNLKKYYKTAKGMLHAVDDVTLDIEQGETMGIVGESGCGKSTLGKTVLRLVPPTAGEVLFDGKDIAGMTKKQFRQMQPDMQMIFQDPFSSLNPRMTVSQLIEEPLRIFHRATNNDDLHAQVKELMDTAGIATRFENCYPHEMDGGRRQRVGIARALALHPKLIICDEPVSALDVSIQAQVLNLLQDLQKAQNLTYMFITHNLSVVRHISNNICVMYLGKIVEISESKELFRRTLHPYSQALLSAIPVPSLHNRKDPILLKGELKSPIDPKPGCRFAPRCPYADEKCRSVDPELRDMGNDHYVACHQVVGE